MLGDSAVTMFSSFKNAIIDTFGAEGAVVNPNILEKTEENALFFDGVGYAFALKPAKLRYTTVTIPDPTPQNPQLSYATRNATTDYYNFNF